MHRESAARAWKAEGGRVVGYLCDNIPEELIIAAGLMPYRLSGRPGAGTERIDRLVRAEGCPVPGAEFVRSILEGLLGERFSFLDFLIIPHNRKEIEALYMTLRRVAAANPDLHLPELYLFDRSYLPSYPSSEFNREQLFELRAQIEAWAGTPISDSALADAIAQSAENRSLISNVLALRSLRPARLSGVEALQMIGSSSFMPKSLHSQQLRAFLAEAGDRPERNGPRVFVGGSPIDQPELYALIESLGATVVGEDHCWGARCLERQLPSGSDLMSCLAERQHRQAGCSISYPLSNTIEATTRRALACGAEAAIFCVFEHDEVRSWETPEEIASLRAHGVRCLSLGAQRYPLDEPDKIRSAVAAFLAIA